MPMLRSGMKRGSKPAFGKSKKATRIMFGNAHKYSVTRFGKSGVLRGKGRPKGKYRKG